MIDKDFMEKICLFIDMSFDCYGHNADCYKCDEILSQYIKEHDAKIIDKFARDLELLIRHKTLGCYYDFTIEDLRNLEDDIENMARQLKEDDNEFFYGFDR